MPRNTRAAVRANAILADDAQDAHPAPTGTTPDKERAPLGDIDANNVSINEEVPPVDNSEPPTKPKSKGKKTKVGKKGSKKQPVVDLNENVASSTAEIKEDESVSDASDAVTKACEDLMKASNDAMSQTDVKNDMSTTPPSPAVEAVRMQLQEAQSTNLSSPPNQPGIPKQPTSQKRTGDGEKGVTTQSIGSPLLHQLHQAKPQGEALPEANEQAHTEIASSKEDLSAKKTSSRSPPRSARIEDSVEAIDVLEEAIEQIGEALPTSRPSSAKRATPTKEHNTTKEGPVLDKTKGNIGDALPRTNSTRASTRPVATAKAASSVTSKKDVPKPARTSVQLRAATKPPSTRPSIAKAPTPKPSSLKESTLNAQQPTKVAPPSTKQRPISASLRAPPPLKKSTKPPTKSTFELPGEAISRKLKEQREERLKREEEEKQKKREFKARPIRRSIAPVVKPTAASRARASLLHGDLAENDHAPKIKAPKIKAPKIKAPRVSTISANGFNSERASVLTVSKRSSVLPAAANTSARRSVSNSSSNDTKVAPTTAFVPNSAVTSQEIAQQKLKGKEVFKRDRLEKEEMERKRKEKEEAAKAARVAAAERGRQASREWAERQKKAKAAAAGKRGMESRALEAIDA